MTSPTIKRIATAIRRGVENAYPDPEAKVMELVNLLRKLEMTRGLQRATVIGARADADILGELADALDGEKRMFRNHVFGDSSRYCLKCGKTARACTIDRNCPGKPTSPADKLRVSKG